MTPACSPGTPDLKVVQDLGKSTVINSEKSQINTNAMIETEMAEGPQVPETVSIA